jgi:hypothetical protein
VEVGPALSEALEGIEVLCPEHRREGLDREEEVFRGAHEGAGVALERPAGNDAVHVRMGVQRLAPGVEHHDDAKARVPAVGDEGLERLGGGLKEQPVDRRRVVAGKPQQGVGQGEDDVEVLWIRRNSASLAG